jgi:drug/metabolite transporter (DMT)-like permease
MIRGGRGLAVRPLTLLLAAAGVGFLEVIGDSFLTYVTALGELGVVSILASLDPVVTVLLAQVIVMERLPRLQAAGVGLALVGTLLVASG